MSSSSSSCRLHRRHHRRRHHRRYNNIILSFERALDAISIAQSSSRLDDWSHDCYVINSFQNKLTRNEFDTLGIPSNACGLQLYMYLTRRKQIRIYRSRILSWQARQLTIRWNLNSTLTYQMPLIRQSGTHTHIYIHDMRRGHATYTMHTIQYVVYNTLTYGIQYHTLFIIQTTEGVRIKLLNF